MMKNKNIGNGFWVMFLCLALLCGCGKSGQNGTIFIGADAHEGSREESSRKENVREENNGKEDSREIQKEDGKEYGIGSGTPEGSGTEENPIIRVYVCGAVANPGVVSVPAGSRAEDALLAAGGFREDAGREAVNLADWIQDGQMLYFPTEEEAGERTPEPAGEPAAGGVNTGLVNINTADTAQLCTLPGIGESRAADIIAYRDKNGGFANCEEIMQVPGIKTSVYEKIMDKITVK